MKIYVVGYYSNLYDGSNEILCAYRNEEDAMKKVNELSFEANDIDNKIINCDAEESQELWNKYFDKYGIDPNEIVFYFTETELI